MIVSEVDALHILAMPPSLQRTRLVFLLVLHKVVPLLPNVVKVNVKVAQPFLPRLARHPSMFFL